MSIFLLFISFVVFSVVNLPSCFSADQQYEECSLPLICGSGQQVFESSTTYPFWGSDKPKFCGQSSFQLSCENNQTLSLDIGDLNLRVRSVNLEDQVITVVDESWLDGNCPQIWNFTGEKEFTVNLSTDKIDLFDCHENITSLSNISCQTSSDSRITYHVFGPAYDQFHNCTKVGEIPMLRSAKNYLHQSNDSNRALKLALDQGFDLKYNIEDQVCQTCTTSNGICGSESGSENFQCLCEDKPHKSSCHDNQGRNIKAKAGIGAASALVGVILIVAGLFCVISCQRKTSDDVRKQNLTALIPLKHYSYAQVQRITKSFAEVVGKGGFGTVYKGTLSDGRSVAVKILKDSKGNGEDFINEVASMSKTSHVNIVTLLGFCSEGSKRAILYEFVENGSLDRFIARKTSMGIDWMALYSIALGIARGLEYLHHGCKTRIVHFDIKPQNILLDDNFCPKVSDFGLAKLCEKKESTMSLANTRGTIGYIAPELFSRMYGRVSHKSDVYSYGMLLLEMIGARNRERAEQSSASNTSSMYFPEWIYKDLEKSNTRRLTEDGNSTEEEEVVKKMMLVGLWCIQPSPSDRPAMNRVIEMMEGNLDALEVPPRPFFQIPAAPLQESSSLSEDISIYTEVCSTNV
ncbi:PREDICTED: LEAF RUST 10 DISEASE-RESISTANCE LOCUS RECEPTOR-LIKE PROTEIN KINASE-like 2.5 [Camelina sativa]|uniref:non-specific serine/threonine protein kinase n=1 Tax=Camelina sativa TaxID=90675 RepID=A0ABM0WG11_CAMSA|nr:PREDICTED: LEAF RUST 10 DISEASE-RESISTANCE LOCUS RECEPTOR-LIKE PROTEIN KINASE-like 2.5 [Camelina sativa]